MFISAWVQSHPEEGGLKRKSRGGSKKGQGLVPGGGSPARMPDKSPTGRGEGGAGGQLDGGGVLF